MQIVIDIPDNHNFKEDVKIAYELIRHREDIPLGTIGFLNMLYQRIDKIIPLPKGHGRLIDADEITYCWHNGSAYAVKEGIINEPTILEADKGDS